ncbi:prenylcysteine oxidase 1-like [Octopus vulgaris]|uniref:Prenylcysteine oxidase 1-like n=1 Tax=Octopus vulgaris TaxID=6645 RepID=A0AA36FJA6_OCTVU|nr:prenylcysteine oxidase 1-like [Octopus vulgaris]
MSRLLLSLTLLLYLRFVSAFDEELPRIAIVGAGIGGTSTAYYLRQLFGDQAIIDIYESNSVGGRLDTLKFDGEFIETGGSTLHPKNAYMLNFTKILGLEAKELENNGFGIYDGKEFQFRTSSYKIVTLLKAFWRYGNDLQRVANWVDDLISKKFTRIYNHQLKGYAFTTVKDLLLSMDQLMLNLTTRPLEETLKEMGFSDRFIAEPVTVAVRTNYGQTVSMQSFAGSIALAGMQPGLFAIKGGNKQVSEKLLEESKANFIHAEVKKISLLKEHDSIQYELFYKPHNSTEQNSMQNHIYDIVIIAMPLHQDSKDIKFEGFISPLSYSQPFYRTVATFIQGEVNASFFDFDKEGDLPNTILINAEPYFINSISKRRKNLWKVFSRELLTESEKNLLFKSIEKTTVYNWLAYPAYSSSQKLLPFVLHDQLYYVNAMESAASTIETSVIAARNVALLVKNHWFNLFDYIDEIPNESDENKIKGEL